MNKWNLFKQSISWETASEDNPEIEPSGKIIRISFLNIIYEKI